MSSYEKVVKLACKPKAAPPKAKYLDPIIAATWSDDGSIHDVCKALSPRIREPNSIVVFKALIVLHSMIRNGSTDNVLSYLEKTDTIKLSNVSAVNWEGYETPQNLLNYASYLETRVKAFRDLKHDAIRVQSESNRDLRNNKGIEESSKAPEKSEKLSRSKTIMGRKLRTMTVEKGLLRETKVVQRMIGALIKCRFYLDNLEDELIVCAMGMLVKDLLILFQASNEGVVNVLEHYFEMSQVDAKQALEIYRRFCSQTEAVVEYLSISKKLQNVLHVSIPNLKHAPVSLAGALQEYLNDPDFEKNRSEYRASKMIADGSNTSSNVSKSQTVSQAAAPATRSAITTPEPSNVSTSQRAANGKQAMQDFFSAIEEEAPTMFDPRTGSPNTNYFHQQAAHNPFGNLGSLPPQATGLPAVQPAPFVTTQSTGYPMFGQPNFQPQPLQQPQMTGFPSASFGQLPMQSQPTGHRPFSAFLAPQPSGFAPIQPQMTGAANPFRASMLLPQQTGQAAFGGLQQSSTFPASFPPPMATQSTPFSQSPTPFSQSPGPFSNMSTSATAQFPMPAQPPFQIPQRPASTPLATSGNNNFQPVKTHQTGSRNPFGEPVMPAPPVPKAPTMMELAMGFQPNYGSNGTQSQNLQSATPANGVQAFNATRTVSPSPSGVTPQSQMNSSQFSTSSTIPSFSTVKPFDPSTAFATLNGAGHTDMGSIASSFAQTTITPSSQPSIETAPSVLNSSLFDVSGGAGSPSRSQSMFASSMPSNATGVTSLQTGLPELKPFKPTSSFGASLFESLPPISQSPVGTPTSEPNKALGGPFSQFGTNTTMNSFPSSNPTGAPVLRPQFTGGPNPFRASSLGPIPSFGTGTFPFTNASSPGPQPSSNPPASQSQQTYGSLI